MEFQKRLLQAVRILRLNRLAIRNVSMDPAALGMGINIAAISGLLASVASLLRTREGILNLFLSPINSILGVVVLAALVHLFSKILGGKGSFQGMFRVLSYSTLLLWFSVLKLIPGIQTALDFVLGVWLLVVAVIGCQECEQFGFGRAIAAVLLPVSVLALVLIFLQALTSLSAY